MKKIITTVGTSIFTNYFDKKKNSNIDSTKEEHYEKLKNKPYSEWENYKSRIDKLKQVILSWVKNNKNASAEIKSLERIKKSLKDDLEVYLLTSDTILSNVAAEIVEEYFDGNQEIKIQGKKLIEELQVKDAKKFSQEGLNNLISKIGEIAMGYYDNVIFNITGGYKAVIPYITIIAQINGCDIYYIFEDTDALIKIPKTPIKVDFDEIEKNYELLKEIEGGIENYHQWKKENYNKIEKLKGFIEAEDEIALLSPMGKIFLSKYEQKYFTVYTPDEVWKDIEDKGDIKRILETKFCFKEQRKSQSEQKKGFIVFDDGNNQNRIFYFEENGKIYIYKVFTDHDRYEQYLKSRPELLEDERERIKRKSKQRKIEINRR